MKRAFQLAGFGVAILLPLLAGSSYLPPLLVQAAIPEVSSTYYSSPPTTPPGGGVNGGAHKGGNCPEIALPLTPLVPSKEQDGVVYVWGRTVSERPTLWFYMPYTFSEDVPVRFVVQDQQGKEVYRAAPQLPSVPSVIGIQIPASASLQVNEFYQWSLQVACIDPPIKVSGWIQRVDATSVGKLPIASKKSVQQAMLYAKQGIWFDALTMLAELRQVSPKDATLANTWNTLLSEVGRQDVASQAIAK